MNYWINLVFPSKSYWKINNMTTTVSAFCVMLLIFNLTTHTFSTIVNLGYTICNVCSTIFQNFQNVFFNNLFCTSSLNVGRIKDVSCIRGSPLIHLKYLKHISNTSLIEHLSVFHLL